MLFVDVVKVGLQATILTRALLSSIVIRVTDTIGPSPILSVIHTITIGRMLNVKGGNYGHGLKNVTCKQTLINKNAFQ